MSQCQFPLSRYPAVYGVSYRTILRWAAKGYPLDDEPATRLLVAGQKIGPSRKSTNPPSSHANAPSRLPDAQNAALGLAASIGRLREAEAQAHADYLAAVSQGDEIATNGRQRQWLALSEQLRKTESSTPDVEAANKSLVNVGEISAALSELFVTHRQDLENLGKRIAAELVAKDEIAIAEVINREAAVLIETLYSCKFLAAGNGRDDE